MSLKINPLLDIFFKGDTFKDEFLFKVLMEYDEGLLTQNLFYLLELLMKVKLTVILLLKSLVLYSRMGRMPTSSPVMERASEAEVLLLALPFWLYLLTKLVYI